MNELLQIMGSISKVTTLANKDVKVTLETGELTTQQMTQMFSVKGLPGWFVFKPNALRQEDIPEIDADFDEVTKSPAQRLRGALYILWEQHADRKQYPEFEVYYRAKMERIIESVKEKIDG